jgi:outer membrane protein insertion porin family
VIGMHFSGKFISGYGGKTAPPFSRFYMGGENDIRGFDIWGISPFAYIPSQATMNVLNSDGSIRSTKVVNANGTVSLQGVTQQIPIYQFIAPGGDTAVVTNFEYRIPIVGPVTLALFDDTGADRLIQTSQLRLSPDRISALNSTFPEASFPGRALIAPGTESVRMSTGLELQVLMPVVNAPFRLYWAYNPLRARTTLQPPVVADRSYFPNAATFNSAVAQFGQPTPFYEKASTFRFSIGRTF